LSQANQGQASLGQGSLEQGNLGQTDLGQTDLGQTDHHDGVEAFCPVLLAPLTASHRRVTILLVEDEAFVREVAGQILCRAGYCVLKARNAAEAVRAFRCHANNLELLLTDIVLPDCNGSDLALELTTQGHKVKAILISGYPENSVTRKGLRPGWSYLPKPFSANSLLQKVREVLEEETGAV
jgi:DNA-binding NtrC family response regulator